MNQTYAQFVACLVSGSLFVALSLALGKLLRKFNKTTSKHLDKTTIVAQKSSYECGEEPLDINTGKFPARYYLIALCFVLFEVELAFLVPYAFFLPIHLRPIHSMNA